MRELLQMLPMVVLVAIAAAIDVRSRRLPNWVTFSLILSGLAQACAPGGQGAVTVGHCLAGISVGLGLTLFLFALGPIGAGDVKLLAGIGAWVGPLAVLQVFAATSIAGMVIVVWRSARGRALGSLARGSAAIVLNAANGDWQPPPEREGQRADFERLPYAVPVLVGVVCVLVAKAWRWL